MSFEKNYPPYTTHISIPCRNALQVNTVFRKGIELRAHSCLDSSYQLVGHIAAGVGIYIQYIFSVSRHLSGVIYFRYIVFFRCMVYFRFTIYLRYISLLDRCKLKTHTQKKSCCLAKALKHLEKTQGAHNKTGEDYGTFCGNFKLK